jgi:hypothetical protein
MHYYAVKRRVGCKQFDLLSEFRIKVNGRFLTTFVNHKSDARPDRRDGSVIIPAQQRSDTGNRGIMSCNYGSSVSLDVGITFRHEHPRSDSIVGIVGTVGITGKRRKCPIYKA